MLFKKAKTKDYKILFGNNNLEKDYDLHQKSDFASKSFVTIEGPKGKIENVWIVFSKV